MDPISAEDVRDNAISPTLDTAESKNSSRRKILAEATFQDTFPQGCQFSPDGLCLLTAQNNDLLLYNTEFGGRGEDDSSTLAPWKPALTCPAGDSVRAYQWYPHMDSSDPSTCCFIGTARDQPVHLYDAYTGKVRATYSPYNRLDEMESPATICFANNGQQIILGGFRTDRMLHVFDLNRPGRESAIVLKLGKTRRSSDGQKGLVSATAVASLQQNLLAVGTYSPGSIYLYDLRTQASPVSEIVVDGTCVVGHGKSSHSRKRKHFVDPDDETDPFNFSAAKVQWYQSRTRGGVTQVEFSPDCQFLFSSSRKSNAVLQWDLRKLSSSSFCPGVASYETCNNTNQRLGFAFDGERRLVIGGQDNCVRIYNLDGTGSLVSKIDDFGDAVNGVSLHTFGEKKLMATSIGSRRFPSEDAWDLDSPYETVNDANNGWLCLSEINEE